MGVKYIFIAAQDVRVGACWPRRWHEHTIIFDVRHASMHRSEHKGPMAVEVALNDHVRALVSGMLLEMRRFEEAGWLFVVVFDGATPPSQGAYFRISIKGTEEHLSTHAGLCKYNHWSTHDFLLLLFFSSLEIRLLLCVSTIWSLNASAFSSDLFLSPSQRITSIHSHFVPPLHLS